MFTVKDYTNDCKTCKIVFKKRWHDKRRPISAELRESKLVQMPEGDGRYDTVCEIYIKDLEVPCFTGTAKLHPNDCVDRVVGKKIALQNAMIRGYRTDPISKKKVPDYHLDFCIKSKRTAIWEAFWEWVAS